MEDLHVQPAKPPTNTTYKLEGLSTSTELPEGTAKCSLVFSELVPHVLSRGQLQNDDNYLFHPLVD